MRFPIYPDQCQVLSRSARRPNSIRVAKTAQCLTAAYEAALIAAIASANVENNEKI
jgi:hypothetical protein